MDDLWQRISDDLADVITSMTLTGTAGVIPDIQQVYAKMLPEQRSILFPCILLTTEGEAPSEGRSNLEFDGVVYPVKVLILDSIQPNLEARKAIYRSWRHDLSRKIRGLCVQTILTNCPEVYNTHVRNLPDVTRAGATQIYQAGLVADFDTMERRQKNVN